MALVANIRLVTNTSLFVYNVSSEKVLKTMIPVVSAIKKIFFFVTDEEAK